MIQILNQKLSFYNHWFSRSVLIGKFISTELTVVSDLEMLVETTVLLICKSGFHKYKTKIKLNGSCADNHTILFNGTYIGWTGLWIRICVCYDRKYEYWEPDPTYNMNSIVFWFYFLLKLFSSFNKIKIRCYKY